LRDEPLKPVSSLFVRHPEPRFTSLLAASKAPRNESTMNFR
jgi:hypothetical protein